jgi:hypothetical protein
VQTNDQQVIIQLLTEIRDLLRAKPRAQRHITVQDTAPGFNAFWALYPKKVGRGAAEMEWNKLKPDEVLQGDIHRSLGAQCRSAKWCEDGGKFIPNPSTWLHQKRWMDEVAIAVQVQHVKPRSLVDLL